MTAGTAQDFIAQLEARLGHPYSETIDGGVGPQYYDCSGLVMVCLRAIGINFTRTTYSQWADQRYQHLPATASKQVGDVIYMHVSGEADPGHVGVYVGNGEFINAPHTGAFVRIETISDSVSEHIFGIIRPPFANAPAPPAPAPAPAPPATHPTLILFPTFEEAPLTEDQFFAWVRTLWYLLRKDLPAGGEAQLLWTLFNTPGNQQVLGTNGFAGSYDLVVANIHDTAGSSLK